ncbi:G/U mismatch-specific DNA glycosylase [compost metagenome]
MGKGVYEQYSGRRGISWGSQPQPMVAGVIDYVCPSSSGLVRMKLEDMVAIYRGILTSLVEPV